MKYRVMRGWLLPSMGDISLAPPRNTAHLDGLSDHLLRDIGLVRDKSTKPLRHILRM